MGLLDETRMTLKEAAEYMSHGDTVAKDHTIRRWITCGVGRPKIFLEGFADSDGLKTTKEALNRFAEARALALRVTPKPHTSFAKRKPDKPYRYPDAEKRARELGILV